MKYEFNGKIYEKGKGQKASLRYLMLEIFKQYLHDNENLSFKYIKNKFENIRAQGVPTILEENEYLIWYSESSKDTKRDMRYFPPIIYNNLVIYFTNQWGDNGGKRNNITKFINFARNNLKYEIKMMDDRNYFQKYNNNRTKNIILYGPPGVGKTYNHKKLISLIESGENQKEIFDAIRNNDLEHDDSLFKTVKKENRFKFVTFHQSYSYEDFIEGFRPNEDGSIKLEDGIFKEMAEKAQENIENSSATNVVSFSQALTELLKPIDEGETMRMNLKRDGSYYDIYDYNHRTIFFNKQRGDSLHALSVKTLEKMYKEESVNVLKGGMVNYYKPTLDKLLEMKYKGEVQIQAQKNFYLLIDEINRGNISKIFGELITLIEDDKRDEIEVTLPYSKESFKVPSNLYIIATMNSTDKSIALIDVALRRRFIFLKMQPDESLIYHDRAKEIFNALNKIIKVKLGEDYLIGHSYFMGESLDLDFVLEYKIKPLMQEYFYGDDKGLEEVLSLIGLVD